MSPALIQAFKKKKEEALREQRPCTLTWGDGESVLAREGVSQLSADLMAAGFTERENCKFYVLKELLPTAPLIGTVFGIEDREGAAWKLMKIRGRGAADVTWIFECDEEHS
jgi:hypothetical protein